MNRQDLQRPSPAALVRSIWSHRALIAQLTRREVLGRYRGSIFGMAWSFFNPLLMLLVYTFVFSVVFEARWGTGTGGSRADFAMLLFVGLIIHGFVAECLTRAPSLIFENVNYVKKVVFPLEVLPLVVIGSALFHSVVSFAVLTIALTIVHGAFPATALFAPLVFAPLIAMTAGFAWFLASIGVFARDVRQVIGILMAVLLFLSPVFYPVSAVPPAFRSWLLANPLTFVIEQSRTVLCFDGLPDWGGIAVYALASVGVAWLGFAWFQKTRKGFADVV